jgi:REP element-mobilizing transposase RayT
MPRRPVPTQSSFKFRPHGGARTRAGRKPKGDRAGVSHIRRPALSKHHPVHVTLRVQAGLPRMRRRREFRTIQDAIRDAHKSYFQVVEFSVQDDHLHLLVEANDRRHLARGMQGLKIRIAKALNRLWGRKGTVFSDRYHARALATPLEVKHALAYVLGNARRHAWQHGRRVLPARWFDPYSSAEGFGGWRERFPEPPDGITRDARTWLLRVGWRRRGLLPLAAIPGAGSSAP